jgi:hypothetical protein
MTAAEVAPLAMIFSQAARSAVAKSGGGGLSGGTICRRGLRLTTPPARWA